jgi:IMP dehydrogenase
MKRGLTYDDILLVPKYSEVKSRSIINTNTLVSRRYGLLKPLVTSCMDTVCEYKMAIKMVELGGVGCIHRFMTIDEQCEQVSKVVEYINNNHMYEHWGVMYDNWHSEIKQIPVMAAIGVNDVDIDRAIRLVLSGVNIVLIDVAHGHHINVKNMIRKLREVLPTSVDIIAGNISTKESAEDLCEWGADGLRVGIGGGSLCTTRIQTGHGVPNVTSIIDCVEGSSVPVMADGGIRNSGDISKALSVGADCVMLGSLLAGTKESPGKIVEKGNGSLYKRYRGSASLETKSAHKQSTKHIEGESTMIPFKGSVEYIIDKLYDGLRSALSYSGSKDIKEFHLKSEVMEITPSGMVESKPHLL